MTAASGAVVMWCPTCRAESGDMCRTRTGRPAGDTHDARRARLARVRDRDSEEYPGMPEITAADLAWQDHAVCQYTDPELFYPPEGRTGTAARKICRTCPVQAECLAWAIRHSEIEGIWGGLNEDERRRYAAGLAA